MQVKFIIMAYLSFGMAAGLTLALFYLPLPDFLAYDSPLFGGFTAVLFVILPLVGIILALQGPKGALRGGAILLNSILFLTVGGWVLWITIFYLMSMVSG